MSNPVCQTTLAVHSHTQITARFDGGNLTSDAGWLLFGSLDRQDRLCEDFSSCIADSRDQRYVRHEQLKLIRQRVFQIVAGYEDCNDATRCARIPCSRPSVISYLRAILTWPPKQLFPVWKTLSARRISCV